MRRISVTTLEKFRRYMTEASPFDTEEALIESIKGIFKGNDKTKFGAAYHELIEGKYQQAGGRVIVGDFGFSYKQAEPAIKYREAHPLMVHECSMDKSYITFYFPIQVTARIDGIEGKIIRDAKTRFSSYKVQDYLDSCQWKFYLDMMELDRFCYDIFKINGFEELPANPPYSTDVIIEEPEEIRCDRYNTMVPDIMTILNDFLHYVHDRNLVEFLKPAISETIFI